PLLLCCITLFIGCSRHPAGVMDALRFAGDNRDELERVLEHYADEPMKLEAARFLIENMPGHYSYADTRGINRYYRSMDSLLTVMPKDDMQKRVDAIDSLGYAYSILSARTATGGTSSGRRKHSATLLK
ncbi:MAG: hypothetical protein K2L78_00690, partial [Muribaculaceae bacterium]|nr:hypothetical protein [Muribaculaceae bacterium]